MIDYYCCSRCDKLVPSIEIYRIVNTIERDEEGDYLADYYCYDCFQKMLPTQMGLVKKL